MTPSSHSDPVVSINEARASLAHLRSALIAPAPGASPDRILACLPALAEAAAKLSVVESELLKRDGGSVSGPSSRTTGRPVSRMKQSSGSARVGGPPADSGEITRAVESLKSDLRGVMRLIEHGALFYRGWARLLGAAAGYTPTGEAAPLDARGSVALDG